MSAVPSKKWTAETTNACMFIELSLDQVMRIICRPFNQAYPIKQEIIQW